MMSASFDANEFLAKLNLGVKRVSTAAIRGMNENKNDLLKHAKLLVAKDEGTLERSGVAGHTEQRRGGIEAEVGFNAPYAAKVHEEMKPAPDAKISPGETTRAKPPTEFGPAGGQYLVRPLIGKKDRYTKNLASRIKEVL